MYKAKAKAIGFRGQGQGQTLVPDHRYFSTAPRTVTPAEVVAAIEVRRRLKEANSDDLCFFNGGSLELSSLPDPTVLSSAS